MITKENEYRAALYCRLSSDDAYLGESGSIQTQKALLTQYCKENGIAIYCTTMKPRLVTNWLTYQYY